LKNKRKIKKEIESDSDKEESEKYEPMEMKEAVVAMFNAKEIKAVKIMKFRGEINQIPICAVLDSGNTHSFVHLSVLQENKIKLTQTIPMVVTIANGARMVTDLQCEALSFSIQGHTFTKDVRVLDVQGYDMILDIDWLIKLAPMKIDWGKGHH
jgi:Retroviral aspartyl protease